MKLSFLGAAREVTGSCVLVETADCRFLVDCGMFQGGREAPARNRRRFEFEPAAIDFVLLTHAHIDHSGLLPRLAREGFTGPVYATRASIDLLGVMLPDSGHIQEMDAQRELRRRGEKGAGTRRRPPTPLYTADEARQCLRQLRPVEYGQALRPHAGIGCTWHDAGHILGSAILELVIEEQGRRTRVVVSGALGQPGRPIVRDPTPLRDADVVLIESTYGDRAHRDLPATLVELEQVLSATLRRGGNVVVPAFAVGRTQEILYHLASLARLGRLPPMQVFVDSPMATAATEITLRHTALFDEEARSLNHWWQQQGNGAMPIRYVERAEYLARILEVTMRLTSLPIAYVGSRNEWESAVATAGCSKAFAASFSEANEANVMEFLAFSPQNPSSICNCIELARTNARAVRTAIEMLDPEGRPRTVLRAGDPLRLRFHYEVARPLGNLSFGFRLFSEMGTLVTETSTRLHDIGLPMLAAGEGRLDLDIDALNLMPGRYYLTVGVTTIDGPVHDTLHHCARLDIEPGRVYGTGRVVDSRHGFVFFPQRWGLQGVRSLE